MSDVGSRNHLDQHLTVAAPRQSHLVARPTTKHRSIPIGPMGARLFPYFMGALDSSFPAVSAAMYKQHHHHNVRYTRMQQERAVSVHSPNRGRAGGPRGGWTARLRSQHSMIDLAISFWHRGRRCVREEGWEVNGRGRRAQVLQVRPTGADDSGTYSGQGRCTMCFW